MIVRPETAADHEAIRTLLTDAFGGHAEARLVDLLRARDDHLPDLALVADRDGEVVGHIFFSRVLVEDPTTGTATPALALAPMAVAPGCQRQGIGSALAQEALERAKGRAEAAVIVLGHPEYYPRFGFEPASRFGIAPPWPEIRDEAFMALPLRGYTDACRGVVVYPSAFDAV